MASADAGNVSEQELRRYLATAESLHHKIQLLGFEKSVRIKIGLDDLYVPLDTMIDRGRKGREVYDSAQHAELAKRGGHEDPSHSEIPLAEAFTRARAMDRRGLNPAGRPKGGQDHAPRAGAAQGGGGGGGGGSVSAWEPTHPRSWPPSRVHPMGSTDRMQA